MDNRNFFHSQDSVINRSQTQPLAKSFLANVFGFMFVGLFLTGITAWYFSSSEVLLSYLYDFYTGKPTVLFYIAAFAPLGLVLLMSFGMNKLSGLAMTGIFILYAVINGVSFSSIFLVYSMGAIYKAFFMASLVFGLMAVVGYTTKTDLTKLGNILMIGLVAMILASLINYFFLESEPLDYLISVIGIVIFTGLTAYDVQKLKRIGTGVEFGMDHTRKLVIMGALTLYLDFINLFLFILRMVGNNRE